MPLTLVPEDGTGIANANTYVSLAEATAYFEARLYGTAFTGAATDDLRNRSLAMATKQIDQEAEALYGGFDGTRATATQALAWPRWYVPDPDPPVDATADSYLADDELPVRLKDATCEMAMALLEEDRTDDVAGQGLESVKAGSVEVKFDKSGRQQKKPLTRAALALLMPLFRGTGAGAATLVRC